jgi:predicted ATP-grasp superfamily ATP-dependent carboligase
LPGLQGYVGVDLVLTNQEAWLMEINPRLTTTYIGLRQVIQLNLAQAMWQACFEARLPDQVSIHGQVFFEKDDLFKWDTTI